MIYSSINYTLSVLSVNYGTLMSYVKFGYLYGPNSLILSLNPLTLEEQSRYVAAPLSSSSYQLYIEVYDALGNLLHTAESARQLHT